jgi:uncharacterized protein (TIGR02145 family)
MSKTYLSSRAAALSPEGHFIARSAFFRLRSNFIARSAFIFLMLCWPALLAAQDNGVTVSNLSVNAGSPTTVTFDVSWSNTGMQDVWSDTVWVWVDYNNNGKMERLPVTGATASAGTVTKIPNNDKGVWIAGNARDADTFSTTIQLLTALADFSGACAYASNYPPVGEYIAVGQIAFTGTPPYNIVLKDTGGGTETRTEGSPYAVLPGYTVQSFTDKIGAPGIMKCTAPGSTVNFTAFNPCSDAATGSTWTLQDTREAASTNTAARARTYKVKKMQDGRIWMVQDMKFGDKCGKTAFSGLSGDQTGNLSTVFTGYYGDCMNVTNKSTPDARGYLYDWAAAVNKVGAYYGSNSYQGCSGTTTAANACQGICPVGWHVPTGGISGEFYDLHTNYGRGCRTNNDDCWDNSSDWQGVYGGYFSYGNNLYQQGEVAHYWSSTNVNTSNVYVNRYEPKLTDPGTRNDVNKRQGYSLRCVRNY